jgi:hypothetical protein
MMTSFRRLWWVEHTSYLEWKKLETHTILKGDFLEICYLTISKKKGEVMVS